MCAAAAAAAADDIFRVRMNKLSLDLLLFFHSLFSFCVAELEMHINSNDRSVDLCVRADVSVHADEMVMCVHVVTV